MGNTYELTIRIDKKILATMTASGYALCIQKYLNNGGKEPVANVVAFAKPPKIYSATNRFGWTNNYEIAAVAAPYAEGGYLNDTETEPLPITTTKKDAFVLTDWSNYNVLHNQATAPTNGFAFEPHHDIANPGASVAVYVTTAASGGLAPTKIPFYLSPLPVIGGSHNQLIPVEKVVVFFYQGTNEAKSGSMISHSRAFDNIIDLTQNPKQTWRFNDAKHWDKEE